MHAGWIAFRHEILRMRIDHVPSREHIVICGLYACLTTEKIVRCFIKLVPGKHVTVIWKIC